MTKKTTRRKRFKQTKDKNNPLFFNNLIAYILLVISFGSYLSIVLIEKDFTPSRITLALNACSGIMFLATGQITTANVRHK